MMRNMRVNRTMLVAIVASSVAAAGCGGFTGGYERDAFIVEIDTPQDVLVPGKTTETQGSQVLSSLFTGLVTYDMETNDMTYQGVAESIESSDSQNFTVTLKDGWTFHDGSPITSDSFIKAWNFAANPENMAGGATFFNMIKGFDEMEGAGPDAALSGVQKVDDKTFTVELKAPFQQWPLMTGYNAYFPMPEAFYSDQEAFHTRPIGNGPFKAASDYSPTEGIKLERFEEYAGERKAKSVKMEYVVISDMNTAYRNVEAGDVDVADVPPDALGTVEEKYGDRYINRDASGFDYMGFPTYDERFADKRVRQAFSMAIDRDQLAEAIYKGGRLPAASVVPPTIPGSRPDACKYCKKDVEQAKKLLAESGFDTSQKVELWVNGGAGHEKLYQAIGNQLKENLGVDYTLRSDLQFAEYLDKADSKGFNGPFRLGWGMDYPSPQNFLEPLFTTAAQPPVGSNSSFYSNQDFDKLVAEGNQAGSDQAAIAKYNEAEDVLLEDLPVAPLFFRKEAVVYSELVKNVNVDGFGIIRTDLIEMT